MGPPASGTTNRLHAALQPEPVRPDRQPRVHPQFASQKKNALVGPSLAHRNLRAVGRSQTSQAIERISTNGQARYFRHCTRRVDAFVAQTATAGSCIEST